MRDAVVVLLMVKNAEHFSFGILKLIVGRFTAVVRIGQNFCAGVNERSLHPLVTDDVRVVTHMSGMRNAVDNFRQIRGTSDRFQIAAAFQFLGQRDQVNAPHPLILVQPVDRSVDLLVGVQVEVVSLERLADFIDRFIEEQNAAEDAALRIQILRRQPDVIHCHVQPFQSVNQNPTRKCPI